jgi:hypothetical protein
MPLSFTLQTQKPSAYSHVAPPSSPAQSPLGNVDGQSGDGCGDVGQTPAGAGTFLTHFVSLPYVSQIRSWLHALFESSPYSHVYPGMEHGTPTTGSVRAQLTNAAASPPSEVEASGDDGELVHAVATNSSTASLTRRKALWPVDVTETQRHALAPSSERKCIVSKFAGVAEKTAPLTETAHVTVPPTATFATRPESAETVTATELPLHE